MSTGGGADWDADNDCVRSGTGARVEARGEVGVEAREVGVGLEVEVGRGGMGGGGPRSLLRAAIAAGLRVVVRRVGRVPSGGSTRPGASACVVEGRVVSRYTPFLEACQGREGGCEWVG